MKYVFILAISLSIFAHALAQNANFNYVTANTIVATNITGNNVIYAANYLQAGGKVYAGSDFVTPYSFYGGCLAISGNSGMFASGTYNNGSLSPTLNFGDTSYKSIFVWHPGKAAMMVGTINGAYQDYLVGSASYSFGKEVKATSAGSFVIGQFNAIDTSSSTVVGATSPLFTIGNGDSDALRSNAFVVYKNGSVQMNSVSYDTGNVTSLNAGIVTSNSGAFTNSLKVGSGTSTEKFAVFGNIYANQNLLLGASQPSRHSETNGYNSMWIGNSNSGLIAETSSGFKGLYLSANTVRSSTLGWTHQDTSQPAWMSGVNYETQYTDRFSIMRSAPTAGSANFMGLFVVNGAGNVGIGTSTPSERLAILSPDNASSTNVLAIRANNGTQGVGISYTGIRKTTNNGANDLYLDAASTGNVILNSNGGTGNIGIGTSAPTAKLDVNGNARFSGNVVLLQPQGDISMGMFNN